MQTVTWRPKTNPEYDALFEQLRVVQYQNTAHPLWNNYSADHFYKECTALTIVFNNGAPEFCGSILKWTCWPAGVYRIVNRFWKINPLPGALPEATASSGPFIRSQLEWVYKHTDCQLAFISRESKHWQRWAVKQLTNFGLDFAYNHNRYLTCVNEDDTTCWQTIVYHGNEDLLKHWKHK